MRLIVTLLTYPRGIPTLRYTVGDTHPEVHGREVYTTVMHGWEAYTPLLCTDGRHIHLGIPQG